MREAIETDLETGTHEGNNTAAKDFADKYPTISAVAQINDEAYELTKKLLEKDKEFIERTMLLLKSELPLAEVVRKIQQAFQKLEKKAVKIGDEWDAMCNKRK